jgi:hypothetical protein
MDAISLEILFAGTLILIVIAIELGYRAGNTHALHLKKEREKITSTNATAIISIRIWCSL